MSVLLRLLRVSYPRWPLSLNVLLGLNLVYHLSFILMHTYQLTVKVVVCYMRPFHRTYLMCVTIIQHVLCMTFHTACYVEPVLDELFQLEQSTMWQLRRCIQVVDAFSHRILVDLTLMNVATKVYLLYPYATVEDHAVILIAAAEFILNAWCSQIPVVARLPDLAELFAVREMGQGDGS